MLKLLMPIGFLLVVQASYGNIVTDVCSRSAGVVNAISKATNKSCQNISLADLQKIEALRIEGTPYSMACQLSIKSGDFNDLKQLKTLEFNYSYVNRHCTEGQISSDLFNDLSNLENLNLSTIPITSLPPNIFKGLTKLKYLNLSSETEIRLYNLPVEIFKNQGQLEKLDLSGQPYVIISSEWLSSLVSLQELKIDLALLFRLASFSKPLFTSLKALKNLELSNFMRSYYFNEVPVNFFEGLENLKFLSIYNLLGLSVDSKIFSPLVSLEKLKINNQNGYLAPINLGSKPFKNLGKLMELDIQNIGISEIPEDLFEGLSNLRRLDISYNPIQKLPENFFQNQTEIQQIYVHFCGIRKLSDTFISNFYSRPWAANLDLSWGNPLDWTTKSKLRFLRTKDTVSTISYDDN